MRLQSDGALLCWVPSLAFAECMPIAVILTTIVLYKRLGVENDFVTYYTAWLLLPWVLRPFIQRLMPPTLHSRATLVTLEMLVGIVLLSVGYALPQGASPLMVNTLMSLVGVCGVMHSVESDRLYDKTSRRKRPRIYTVGYGFAFFVSMILCHGLVVTFAGNMEVLTRTIRPSWQWAFYFLGALFFLLALLHVFTLRRPDRRPMTIDDARIGAISLRKAIRDFFGQRQAWLVAGFLVFYLLPEGLLSHVASLFVIDARHNGGLGLSPAEYGLVQGTMGMAGVMLGGMIGGLVIRRVGLRRCLWPMAFAMVLPGVIFYLLSRELPGDIWLVSATVTLAQFFLGTGLSAYVLYLTHYNRSGITLAHYTLCASFVALPLMLPAFYAGTWQQMMGYRAFFKLATALSLLSFVGTWMLTKAERLDE